MTGYDVVKIGLDPPRDELYARLDRRSGELFEKGIVEETSSILARGYSPEAKPFESLGYKQSLAVLQGKLSRDAAIAETQLQTRRYAKRQLTWFRREKDMLWFHGFGDSPEVVNEVCETIASRLR